MLRWLALMKKCREKRSCRGWITSDATKLSLKLSMEARRAASSAAAAPAAAPFSISLSTCLITRSSTAPSIASKTADSRASKGSKLKGTCRASLLKIIGSKAHPGCVPLFLGFTAARADRMRLSCLSILAHRSSECWRACLRKFATSSPSVTYSETSLSSCWRKEGLVALELAPPPFNSWMLLESWFAAISIIEFLLFKNFVTRCTSQSGSPQSAFFASWRLSLSLSRSAGSSVVAMCFNWSVRL
mmetsp:Transcript_37829/g.86551  ORF Transcript_37829/g.86551 Transcript_37829/m.86551 type:complete len:245 (+) Transcript_37829:2108-2842(+)